VSTELKIAERVRRILPSASVAALEQVLRLKAEGRDIIGLTVGEPDCDTPDHVIEAAAAAARAGVTHYTPVTGMPALKRAVVAKLARENGITTTEDQVVIATGAKQIIFTALSATVDNGDEVIVPAPYWVSYPDMVRFHGAEPVIVECPAAQGFKLTPAQLEAAITPRTRWLILNSPNNPTGAVYTEAEHRALIAVLRKHPHVWLMTDEIYEHFVYTGVSAVSPAALDDEIASRCLTVNGVSKAYAMTGWRIGFAVGARPLMAQIAKIISQVTSCPPSVSQAAALAALEGDQSFVHDLTAEYRARRDLMIDGLNAARGITCAAPEGAFYVYADVSGLIGKTDLDGKTLSSDLDVAAYFLQAAGISTIAGTSYGLSPYLRCSFATSADQIAKACGRIAEACDNLA